jgi:response regulator RpfG family c-di-GMP phosphodiesterase
MTETKTIFVAVSDIFFYTKIRDAFLPAGYKLQRLRNTEDWKEKALQNQPIGMIVDMNDDRLNAPDLLKALKATPETASIPVLAFANHEEIGAWKLAKDLGIQKVVSRNEFSARTLALFEELTSSTAS